MMEADWRTSSVRWRAWLKMDSFRFYSEDAQLTLFASISLLCMFSASSSAYDLIFSSRDTWKRLPSVCSLDGLQSVWVAIRGSLLHTNGTIRQTPHPFIILTASECLQIESSSWQDIRDPSRCFFLFPTSFLLTSPQVRPLRPRASFQNVHMSVSL